MSPFILVMLKQRKNRFVFLALLIAAAGFRVAVAHRSPNDAPDDGRVYAQIARNILEQHTFSEATEPPYAPTLIRLPGYPLFVAAIYRVFGHGNNGAVRLAQALIDAATCGLIALLAFYWQPDEERKRATAIAALVLAAVCPFTTIYAATILTEVPTMFLAMAMCVAATFAFRNTFTTEDSEKIKKTNLRKALRWWGVAGLLGGIAVLIRPDSGLFAAAMGMTLVVATFWSAVASEARHRFGSFLPRVLGEGRGEGLTTNTAKLPHPDSLPKGEGTDPKRRWSLALPARSKFVRVLAAGSIFSLAFVIVLVPWTIRNARVFHRFQPLAPAHGEMPGEFVARGYHQWLRTWLDDERYVAPFLWSLDTVRIDLDDVPPHAFDSAQEKDRVAALLDKYNGLEETANNPQSQPGTSPTPQASPTPTSAPDKSTAIAKQQSTKNSKPNSKANSNSNAEDTGDENDNQGEQSDETDNSDQSDQSPESGPVKMTPEIDAGFAQIAQERIARHPFRFYVWLPVARAETMWFDTHSQYWPFEGELLPFEDLDYEHHQQIWLPLFAGLTGAYTLLGLLGGWLLWDSRKSAARRWLLLTGLIIFLRLAFFSTLENPEPRYVVEFFPFLSILGGIAIASATKALKKPQMDTEKHG